ncbi:hypothetical protein IFM89_022501 [Coptis chinensis]|uniref:Mur ligase C-terminal domain-containing protein n=1 Tax=Coptis chinensis TaxID=261450 RepID=A0A835IDP7_9MAGN|nr:hypothetical protein IFM89_022501 [Coptis chinensis]
MLMIREGNRTNPTVHIPPWSHIEDPMPEMFSPLPVSGVSSNNEIGFNRTSIPISLVINQVSNSDSRSIFGFEFGYAWFFCNGIWFSLEQEINNQNIGFGSLALEEEAAPLPKWLLGRHNIVAAVAVGIVVGAPLEGIVRGIEEVDLVPGRCELIDEEHAFGVIVDYAHTPNALSRLLDIVRELSPRRIITVIGYGGDRDRGKRPMIAKIATDKSDVTMLTSNNPRTEDPCKSISLVQEINNQNIGFGSLALEEEPAPLPKGIEGLQGYREWLTGAMVKRFREDPNGNESAGKWVRGTSTLPKVFDQPNGSKLELVWKG